MGSMPRYHFILIHVFLVAVVTAGVLAIRSTGGMLAFADEQTPPTKALVTKKKLAEALQAKPNLIVEIAGHTDSDGSEVSNSDLSQKRATVVTNYLLKRGIDTNRLKPVGYGESSPVASNDTAAGKAQNRRTEVRILSR